MPNDFPTLLIVDNEPYILQMLSSLLKDEFEMVSAASAEGAKRLFARRDFDLILTDQKMPNMTGVQLLEWVRENHPMTGRLLMTGFAQIDEAADAINRGHITGYIPKPWQNQNLLQIIREAARTSQMERSQQRLVEVLRQLNLELDQRVRQRERELEEARRELIRRNLTLERESSTDLLTGLPNRRAMENLAEAELRRRDRYERALCVGLIDVDKFKRINTSYTHSGGDQVLINLAKTLPESLRGADCIGRIGGEEFQVIAPETDYDGAKILGERIRSTVEQNSCDYQGKQIGLTVSIGLAVAEPDVTTNYAQITHEAATALRRAKRTGRNRCVVHRIAQSSSS